jgi:ubiquitin C-terminal hydrolase
MYPGTVTNIKPHAANENFVGLLKLSRTFLTHGGNPEQRQLCRDLASRPTFDLMHELFDICLFPSPQSTLISHPSPLLTQVGGVDKRAVFQMLIDAPPLLISTAEYSRPMSIFASHARAWTHSSSMAADLLAGSTDTTIATTTFEKCTTAAARQAAFNLLRDLCVDHSHNHQRILTRLNTVLSFVDISSDEWDYNSRDHERSTLSVYSGLYNLGCICYMNSLLQQFFMMPALRRALLSAPVPTADLADSSRRADSLLWQLQQLFARMLLSPQRAVNPRAFCHAYKDLDGRPIDVRVQQDSYEFFTFFCDRLEAALAGTPQAKLLQRFFGGSLEHQLACQVSSEHCSKREEPYLALQLEVKNKSDILQSLQLFVDGERLHGDNSVMCQHCKAKVDTVKRACLKRLPHTLILNLKRFEFDVESMTKIKLNHSVTFPTSLNMYAFTREGQAATSAASPASSPHADSTGASAFAFDASSLEGSPSSTPTAEPATSIEDDIVRENRALGYDYRLVGVVVHSGGSDAGHYYSYIQVRPMTGSACM